MTEDSQPTAMTVADIINSAKADDPDTDLQTIRAAFAKADTSDGPLADVLHSLFFHTEIRMDEDGNDPSVYREMPMNQLVALADWYLEQDAGHPQGRPIGDDGVDRVALDWFVQYFTLRDRMSRIFEEARQTLGLPLVPSAQLNATQTADLTKAIRHLIAEDTDGAKILALMAAEQIADVLIASANLDDAEQDSNVTHLADRR